MNKKFVPFWFESSDVYGTVENYNSWQIIKDRFEKSGNISSIYHAKFSINRPKKLIPSFGFMLEHLDGNQTLGEFFDMHEMSKI